MANDRAGYADLMFRILKEEAAFSIIKSVIKENDKAFVNMLFMTAFRQLHFIRTEVLPQFIKKKIPQKRQILEYILYLGATELLFLNTPDYAVINSYVEAAKIKTDKFGANFVNAVLRNILRHKDNLCRSSKSGYFGANFIKILKQDYTADEIQRIEALAAIEPPLDITLKKGSSLIATEALCLPTGSIRLSAHNKITEIEGYKNGDWWVQDAASALPVKCLKDIAGKKVLDICAAPGGKTAQLLDAGALVTAVDISENRLQILKENLNRLKLTNNLILECSDALQFSSNEQYDIILVDAPCSATGTFRRHPEIIHTKTINDVKKQAELQRKILEHVCTLLAPHGIIVYSTCSLAKAEGEKQINSFVKRHPEFSIIPITFPETKAMQTKEGFLRILPYHYHNFGGIDGFFIACLQRNN